MTGVTESVRAQLQTALAQWDGSSVAFNTFRDDHDYLILRIKPRPDANEQDFGLRFFYCTYIAGPTEWNDAVFSVAIFLYPDGDSGFEIVDEKAGFRVQCHGPVDIAGDPKKVFPRT